MATIRLSNVWFKLIGDPQLFCYDVPSYHSCFWLTAGLSPSNTLCFFQDIMSLSFPLHCNFPQCFTSATISSNNIPHNSSSQNKRELSVPKTTRHIQTRIWFPPQAVPHRRQASSYWLTSSVQSTDSVTQFLQFLESYIGSEVTENRWEWKHENNQMMHVGV